MRRPTPLAVAATALLLALAWQYLTVRFNYGTNESKPCFHPVALPGAAAAGPFPYS